MYSSNISPLFGTFQTERADLKVLYRRESVSLFPFDKLKQTRGVGEQLW